MVHALQIISVATRVQLSAYVRFKEAFFYSFIFPVMLFLLFGSIWGGADDPDYTQHLYRGVIAMTVASDALFSIGPVIREYRTTNQLKFFRNLPMNVLLHFTGLFLSRMVSLYLAVLLLTIASGLAFNYVPDTTTLVRVALASLVGTVMFAFLSLSISFVSRDNSGSVWINITYFFMLFTSGAFYPTDVLPDFLQLFTNALPLTHLLKLMDGDWRYGGAVLLWTLGFGLIFQRLFSRFSIKR